MRRKTWWPSPTLLAGVLASNVASALLWPEVALWSWGCATLSALWLGFELWRRKAQRETKPAKRGGR